jgi:hypothetical protein
MTQAYFARKACVVNLLDKPYQLIASKIFVITLFSVYLKLEQQ